MSRPALSDGELALRLEGSECEFCPDGRLVRDAYKGNAAIVCAACGTPIAQFW